MKKLILSISSALCLSIGISSAAFASTDTYTVKSGDTLWDIAQSHNLSVNQLKTYNHLESDIIFPNQQLGLAQAEAATNATTKAFKVSATAYTGSCEGCSGLTATGINLKNSPNLKVISVDPKVIPLGSKVSVEGYGTAIAGDTGGAIKGKKIDVFMPSQKKAQEWGRKTVTVKVLK
ncbi:hypothetical protein GCM10011391_39980 [Pullulanibacillus camelliae]|uniref:LysM domain-containing protein n=1 Tax=Pullulanibacillus camelliae TaxID=1707096 RepID=A0A8J2YPH2_9BACL|nr:3D domain-containing protein [Pullulanibacillus camelliae]GGE57082.1 hypothetical protein GCM10011391_39980 [Pullulanibacillus camelliae]